MRKLILAMQVSLDGFVEGANGDMTWMIFEDREQWDDLFEMLETVDLLLLGSKMFPSYKNYWKQALTNPKASPDEVAYARFAEKTKHIVFSNRMEDSEWKNTEIVKGNVAEEVAKLKKLPGKDIQVVGGAKLAATLIEAGLVDEYRLNIHPVILGKGKSFFKDQKSKSALQLIGSKVLKSEVIIIRYCIKR